MYKKKQPRQYTFQDFDQAFGFPIDPENRWVKLEGQIPWDEVEEIYAKAFASDVGNLAVSARMAFGALVIRRVFGESDRGTVKLIQESPYLQHFLGLPRYEHAQPFDPSLMVRFRERLDLDKLGDITDKIVEFQKKKRSQAQKAGLLRTAGFPQALEKMAPIRRRRPGRPSPGRPRRWRKRSPLGGQARGRSSSTPPAPPSTSVIPRTPPC